MEKYSVIASHIEDDYVWNVYEVATNQIIDKFFFEDDAFDLAEFMENGGAFDGFTPAFMTSMVKVKNENLNEAFAREFMVQPQFYLTASKKINDLALRHIVAGFFVDFACIHWQTRYNVYMMKRDKSLTMTMYRLQVALYLIGIAIMLGFFTVAYVVLAGA